MQFTDILSKLDALENTPKKSIFESIGRGDAYFRTWESDIHPILCEVALQPDQIQKLFKSIETGAGRSALGKVSDTLGAAKDKISDAWFNKFGGMLQNSQPVKDFDAKWEEIKQSIASKNPEIASKLAKYGEMAKAHPNWHKFLLAIAGSVAAALGIAVAGGAAAGALAVGTGAGIAVGTVNIADRLLQGQKASTAIGRGATAGAIAGLTAGAVRAAADALQNLGAVTKIHNSYKVSFNGVSAYVKPEDYQAWKQGMVAADSLTKGIDFMSNSDAYFKASAAGMDASARVAAEILSKASDPAYQEAAAKMANVVIQPGAIGQAAAAIGDLASKLTPVLSAVAGQTAGNAQPKATTESLNRNQLNELFGITGNKVDASTLEKAWKKAGSPTDSEEVKQVLTGAGVDASVVDTAFTDMGLSAEQPADTTQPTPTAPTDAPQDATPPGESKEMSAEEIVGQLKTFWDKVTSNQGSMTGSPQVQQQLIAMAKTAGLATKTFEAKYLNRKSGTLK